MQGFARSVLGVVALVLRIVLGLIAWGAVSGAAAALLGDTNGGIGSVLFTLLLIPVFTTVAVLVHEVGHAVAAWANRWIVDSIVVWPVAYAPRNKKWSWARGYAGRGDVLGWVVAHPKMDSGTRAQETWYTLGGVIANVASAVVFVLLGQLIQMSVLSAVLGALAVISVVMAVTNVLPWKLGGSDSDGARLLEMWSRPARVRKTKSQWNVPRKW